MSILIKLWIINQKFKHNMWIFQRLLQIQLLDQKIEWKLEFHNLNLNHKFHKQERK